MRFEWKKLYKAVDSNRKPGQSWRDLAKAGGFAPSVFTRISQGKAVSVVNLLKILHISGLGFLSLMSFVKSNK